jgi:hypothetical protein
MTIRMRSVLIASVLGNACLWSIGSNRLVAARVTVAPSGKSVLSIMSPRGKAEVAIETAPQEGECLKASAASNLANENIDQVSVVSHLSITVANKKVFVPFAVYSQLSDVKLASLDYRNGTFDLSVNEGVDESLVHIYFNPQRVTRLTEFDYMSATIIEDARFYSAQIK